MKSPKDMRIIQIEVTNACMHRCSNCTRLCGHHQKPFFMDFETFKRAVRSMDGYVGTVGIMGGEPTLHPEFPRLARYLADHRAPQRVNRMAEPQVDFSDSVHDLELEHTFPYPYGNRYRTTVNGAGLWSAMGEGFKKHYEVIQDTIKCQVLNDHTSDEMYHQPALVTRKELKIPDEEWIVMRDNCWMQNLWSASITPKGAFFCEIAAALDMTFEGPGGWEIEPGWWMRTPEDFGDQLQWCEMCGFACQTFSRSANEEIDDVSPVMYEKLKQVGSPKIGTEHINVLKINEDGVIAKESMAQGKWFGGTMPFSESYENKFGQEKTNLKYKELIGIFLCRTREEIEACLAKKDAFAKCYIQIPQSLIDEYKEAGAENIVFKTMESERLGHILYDVLNTADYNVYALVISGTVELRSLTERLNELVLNPGTLLYKELNNTDNEYFRSEGTAYAALLNGTAQSVRDAGWDNLLRVETVGGIRKLWNPKKVIPLAPEMERRAPHSGIEKGMRYAVYGVGRNLQRAFDKIQAGGGTIACLVDTNKSGCQMGEYTVQDVAYLKEHQEEFDRVLISSSVYYGQIKAILLDMGFAEGQMTMI